MSLFRRDALDPADLSPAEAHRRMNRRLEILGAVCAAVAIGLWWLS